VTINAVDVATTAAGTTLGLATPILWCGIGGLVSERSGVLNIGLEGMALIGAFGYYAGAAATGSAIGGIALAVAAAAASAMILAVLAIHGAGDQVITGMAVNLLGSGLTAFLYQAIYGVGAAPTVAAIGPLAIPGLHAIPVLGKSLFDQPVLTYAALLAVPAVAWWLRSTRPGLRLTAAGERPEAVDAAGLNVIAIRYAAVAFSGAACGIAGAYILSQVQDFTADMTAGIGYIALATIIFGNWRPAGVLLGSLLFAAAEAVQTVLQAAGIKVPYDLFLAVPYLVTIVAVSGFVGRVRPPAADGQPYLRQLAEHRGTAQLSAVLSIRPAAASRGVPALAARARADPQAPPEASREPERHKSSSVDSWRLTMFRSWLPAPSTSPERRWPWDPESPAPSPADASGSPRLAGAAPHGDDDRRPHARRGLPDVQRAARSRRAGGAVPQARDRRGHGVLPG
jgi:ABC-type uncharacterized transport system permease subunit